MTAPLAPFVLYLAGLGRGSLDEENKLRRSRGATETGGAETALSAGVLTPSLAMSRYLLTSGRVVKMLKQKQEQYRPWLSSLGINFWSAVPTCMVDSDAVLGTGPLLFQGSEHR